MLVTQEKMERMKAQSEAQRKAVLAATTGSAAGPHVAKGVCIVCGSRLVLAFWRGHPDNRKVHCNDCGSEVTAFMHEKRQPNTKLRDGAPEPPPAN